MSIGCAAADPTFGADQSGFNEAQMQDAILMVLAFGQRLHGLAAPQLLVFRARS
jgi:hypothetical protein